MAKNQNKHDATASLLGFLYQTRFALLLALRHKEPDVLISIEKLDDVAFAREDRNGVPVPFDVRQLKHHLKRQGGLGNKSPDIWKTLDIWAEATRLKRLDPTQALLFLVTTSTAIESNAVFALSPYKSTRDSEKARSQLESAGSSSSDATVQKAFKSLSKLSEKRRKQLFAAIRLLDSSHDVNQLRTDIEAEVRLLTDPQYRVAFADALEGWWFRQVIEHLMASSNLGILVRSVEEQVSDLREQFRRANLPDELATANVPVSEKKDSDSRTFVRQLRLIRLGDRRIRSAQEDHYRAYEQRSRWVRQHLLGIEELHKLETRLTDEWQRRFDIMIEGIDSSHGDDGLVRSGNALFRWVELDAPQNPTLFVRPEFRSSYMTRGSYHMLADKNRVGWHPEFTSLLAADEKEKPDAF
jgi:hypothetical protein